MARWIVASSSAEYGSIVSLMVIEDALTLTLSLWERAFSGYSLWPPSASSVKSRTRTTASRFILP